MKLLMAARILGKPNSQHNIFSQFYPSLNFSWFEETGITTEAIQRIQSLSSACRKKNLKLFIACICCHHILHNTIRRSFFYETAGVNLWRPYTYSFNMCKQGKRTSPHSLSLRSANFHFENTGELRIPVHQRKTWNLTSPPVVRDWSASMRCRESCF